MRSSKAENVLRSSERDLERRDLDGSDLSYNGRALNVLDKKDFRSPALHDADGRREGQGGASGSARAARSHRLRVRTTWPFALDPDGRLHRRERRQRSGLQPGTPSPDYADYATRREAKIVSKRDGIDAVAARRPPHVTDVPRSIPDHAMSRRHRARMITKSFSPRTF
jgi:hypothetical protein